MDDTATTALIKVPGELLGYDTEKFLDEIIALYRDGEGPPFDDLADAIGRANDGFRQAAEQFRDALREAGLDSVWADVARQWVNEGPGSNLCTMRAEAQQAELDAAPTAMTWDAFRDEHRDFWAGWTGADWDGWYASFQQYVPPELVAEVNVQFGYIDSLKADPAKQLVRLSELGFTVNEDGPAASAMTWDAFRDEHRDFWAGWTGADWDGWYASFQQYVPPELVAEVNVQFGYIDSLKVDPAKQLARLSELGFTVNQDALDYYRDAASRAAQALIAAYGPQDLVNDVLAELDIDPGIAQQVVPAVRDRLNDIATNQPEALAGLTRSDLKEQLMSELAPVAEVRP